MACKCDQCGGKLTGLAHIGIFVKDIEVSKAFYCGTLGMELTMEDSNGGTKLALVQVGSLILELIQPENLAPRSAGVVDHIAIAVEDIETVTCKLIEKQIVFESGEVGVYPNLLGGIKNIFFSGPDGERLEFLEQI